MAHRGVVERSNELLIEWLTQELCAAGGGVLGAQGAGGPDSLLSLRGGGHPPVYFSSMCRYLGSGQVVGYELDTMLWPCLHLCFGPPGCVVGLPVIPLCDHTELCPSSCH